VSKADYVRAQRGRGHGGNHHCHWPDCGKAVPPAMWGCTQHWFMLPISIRNNIWRTFRPGQELSKNPSGAYVEAAKMAREWIAAHHPPVVKGLFDE
jgi:hypothetical protein